MASSITTIRRVAVARDIQAMPMPTKGKSPGVPRCVAKEAIAPSLDVLGPRPTRFPLLNPEWAPWEKGPSRVSLARNKLMTKKFPGLKDKRGPSQNIIILLKTAIGPLSSGIDVFRYLILFLTVGQYYVSLRKNRFCPPPSPLEI